VKLKTNQSSSGREARRSSAACPPKKCSADSRSDDPKAVLWARDDLSNGAAVGWLSSGGFGHTDAEGNRFRLRPSRRSIDRDY